MSRPTGARLGTVYRCPVCGAEITVIRDGGGRLAPICCNVPMEVLRGRVRFFCCPVCGAELAVIRRGLPAQAGAGDLAPICCNEPMRLRSAAA